MSQHHNTTCPVCGATYRRWLPVQKTCFLCHLNATLVHNGFKPYKSLPGHLFRFYEREAARQLLEGGRHG